MRAWDIVLAAQRSQHPGKVDMLRFTKMQESPSAEAPFESFLAFALSKN